MKCADTLCTRGNRDSESNPKMCDVSIAWSVIIQFISNTFISIAIVDPKFLVITNAVTPVAIRLVQLVCYVDVDPSLADTICAEEPAKWLRLNGHHSSLKPDPIILPISKVNSNYTDRYMTPYLIFRTVKVERRFKRAWKGSDVCPSIKKVYKIIENKSFLLPYDQYKFV
jgi:hypothetical protein